MAAIVHDKLPALQTPMQSTGTRSDRPGRRKSAYERFFPDVPDSMELTSIAFAAGAPIPARFTADGGNVSPPLAWRRTPVGTRSLMLIVEDVDVSLSWPFVHWLAYNILPDETALPEGIGPQPQVRAYGLVQGRNSSMRLGYTGCAPPSGSRLHHYHFQLFALDRILPLNPGKSRSTVIKAMTGHVLAKCQLIGTYQR